MTAHSEKEDMFDSNQEAEKNRLKQIEENKKKITCSNCVHKKVCTMISGVLSLPVNKFVLSLRQVPFYEGMNKAMAGNCFHFENENKGFYTKHDIVECEKESKEKKIISEELFAYTTSNSEPKCKICNDQYWLYDKSGTIIGTCDCRCYT